MYTGSAGTNRRIPLWVKVAFSLFVSMLVPYYWVTYTPWNFLFFCDVALLMTLAALWLESPLLASISAVGITLPQALWVLDFLTAGRVVGMTSYMFDPKYPLFVRGLSLFHGWLPFLLLWLVWRLGYERRALAWQVTLCWLDLLLCYVLVDDPKGPAGNVNKVFGPSDSAPAAQANPGWVAVL